MAEKVHISNHPHENEENIIPDVIAESDSVLYDVLSDLRVKRVKQVCISYAKCPITPPPLPTKLGFSYSH